MRSALLTATGFQHDRSFILIKDTPPNEDGISEHLTIKTTSKLCLFHQAISDDQTLLTVTYTLHGEAIDSVSMSLSPDIEDLQEAQKYAVSIFGSRLAGSDVGDTFADFFSRHLDQRARLLFVGEHKRDVPAPALIPKIQQWSLASWFGFGREELHPQKQIHFADACPILITTSASEEDARSRFPESGRGEDVIRRFRTNIHLGPDDSFSDEDQDLTNPYIEDTWKRLTIFPGDSQQEVSVDCVFRTVRCMSLNVDFNTGGIIEPERQLYKLLTKDRRVNSTFPMKPCFGVYGFLKPTGIILWVGDKVKVDEKLST